jgi:hypothetical protein
LDDVGHVAHVVDARRIIEGGRLKAQVVYDESRLNRTRTHVCWVSANHWNAGSIYETVEFTIKWAGLVGGRQVFCVEAMTDYRPHACRFLLTDRGAGALKHVTRYDPKKADGLPRQKGKAWFWNGQFTAEFMIDADLSLDLCHRLNFIDHNPRMCRLFGSACKERNQSWADSAAYILGYLIGSGIATVNKAFAARSRLTRWPHGRRLVRLYVETEPQCCGRADPNSDPLRRLSSRVGLRPANHLVTAQTVHAERLRTGQGCVY